MYFSKLLISDIIEFAILKGADETDLCNRIGIDLGAEVNPMEHVDYLQMVDALNIAGKAIDDENFGLHLGAQVILKATEKVDNIMQSSPTIEEAFANAVSYSKLISDSLSSHITKSKHQTKVSFNVNPNWAVHQSFAVQQIIDMTLVCTLKSIFWLTNKKHTPLEVHLNYPSIKRKNEYYKVFDCSVKFNEKIPGIIFSNPVLHQSVSSSDSGLLASLKKVADEEIKNIQTEPPLIISIKEIVLSNLPQKSTITGVASNLHLSSRTLQRKLKLLQTNFKEIEKDILIKLAINFILYEKRDIDEISYLLGFSESSAFIRFFKTIVKTTPNNYRKLKLGPR